MNQKLNALEDIVRSQQKIMENTIENKLEKLTNRLEKLESEGT